MLIDSHCHLDAHEFDADRDAVILAARAAGVSAIVIPSIETKNFAAVRDCCTRHPRCFPAYGIDPLYIDQADETDFSTLREWLSKESIGRCPPVALGEIGLDYFVPGFDAARQEHFFIEQLKIASDFDLPVLLHVRRSLDHVLKYLRRISVRGGIAHAFNGSRQQADEFIRLGFRLGFGGAMTYPGSTRIRKLASTLPINAIVLETDAPDMAPCWLAGERNTPLELIRIARTFSELRGLSLAAVMAATTANVLEILNLPLPDPMHPDSPGMAV